MSQNKAVRASCRDLANLKADIDNHVTHAGILSVPLRLRPLTSRAPLTSWRCLSLDATEHYGQAWTPVLIDRAPWPAAFCME
jgi:hypothetical protein